MEIIPMSHVDSILGLPGLAIERVDRQLGVHVWAKPTSRPACHYCASPSIRIKATHSRTLKHSRQGNQIVFLHLSVPKYHCQDCTVISDISSLGFAHGCAPRSAFGWRYLKRTMEA